MMGMFLVCSFGNLFARAYGGSGYDNAYSVVQASDGSYAFVGPTNSFGAGNYDVFLFKCDPTGAIQWAKTYGGSGYEYAYSLIKTTDNGYVFCGGTDGYGSGNMDVLLVKLTSAGGVSWAKTFGGPGDESSYSVIQTTDGGYAVVGYTNSYGAGYEDMFILKLNSSGGLSWARTAGGGSWDYAFSATQATDGGIIVVGHTSSFGSGGEDIMVVKFNTSGGLTWAKTFGGSTHDRAYSVLPTSDGGCILTGYTYSYTVGSTDIMLLKLDGLGNVMWAYTYGGTGKDWAYSMLPLSGGYAIVGYTASIGAGSNDLLILRVNSSGGLLWARTFGGPSIDEGTSVVTAADGGFTVVGRTSSFGAGNDDALMLEIGADGNYPSCVSPWTPSVTNPTPATTTISVGVSCSPGTSNPTLSVGNPSVTVTNMCTPVDLAEECHSDGIKCYSCGKAIVFLCAEEAELRIYASDGSLVLAKKIKPGENRVELKPGVYIWKAGPWVGRAILR